MRRASHWEASFACSYACMQCESAPMICVYSGALVRFLEHSLLVGLPALWVLEGEHGLDVANGEYVVGLQRHIVALTSC